MLHLYFVFICFHFAAYGLPQVDLEAPSSVTVFYTIVCSRTEHTASCPVLTTCDIL